MPSEGLISSVGEEWMFFFWMTYKYGTNRTLNIFSLSIPCGFLLSTLLGGACLCISSIIYLGAALAGEEWKPCIVSYEAGQENVSTLPDAPNQPPPRLHQVARSTENLYENA
jgi:hypothetical protein